MISKDKIKKYKRMYKTKEINTNLSKPSLLNILGIDPGSTTIGYGAICSNGKTLKPKVLGYGYIDLKYCIG